MKHSILINYEKPQKIPDDSIWFLLKKQEILVKASKGKVAFPQFDDINRFDPEFDSGHFLGYEHDRACYGLAVEDDFEPPESFQFEGLRKLYFTLGEPGAKMAGRALQIVNWDRNHQFCGRCGEKMKQPTVEHMKECPACGLTRFPRLAPAIIVLVTKEDKLLLGRNARFPEKMYSTLAGFVEPGETLEAAVEREVFEESGIRVRNIRYFDSQPWPFPHSLMIGFFADYKSGEIRVDGVELEDAHWFPVSELPLVPPKVSIAGQLIAAYPRQQKA